VDVWDYFEWHKREAIDLSLVESDNFPLQFVAKADNDARGLILGRYLIVDGMEEFARERDPSHYPAVHGHGRHHKWEPAEPTTFAQFVKDSWERVSDLPDEALDDPLAPGH